MKHSIITLILAFCSPLILAQSYISYFTGNETDEATNPSGGVCMMGGALENDQAMVWFLERADGGDILVLRTSGSDGYNDYLYSELGVQVNSVETIVFESPEASFDPYVLQKISQAEAIWFAGGDQWNYLSYWRNTPVDSLINLGITERNIPVGGTSAGMAIMGGYIFSAQNGTVTSETALNDPYHAKVTVDSAGFLSNTFLEDVITDTHYDDPDRKGRHVTFLARILTDYGIVGKGIACDEYTSVCVDTNGVARIFGEYPQYDDNIYFIQPNCELEDFSPEICSDGQSLSWNRSGQALKVYKVQGTITGDKTFDLKNWQSGVGGEWEHWFVEAGVLTTTPGTAIDCQTLAVDRPQNVERLQVFPNPARSSININTHNEKIDLIVLQDVNGRICRSIKDVPSGYYEMDIETLPAGVYFLQLKSGQKMKYSRFVKE
jgi:cyanophycinase-like exopeptidase